jgi:hypothetical protein
MPKPERSSDRDCSNTPHDYPSITEASAMDLPTSPSKHCRRPRGLGGASWAAVAGLAAVLAAAACGGGAADAGASPALDTSSFEGPPFFEGYTEPAEGEPDEPSAAPGAGLGGFVDGQSGGATQTPATCFRSDAQATLVKLPVDIILLLDNSGSMSDELEAVEANINRNFAEILANSGVDYRMILISRHREEARDESDEASTSICVQSPLSGLADCSEAEAPTFSDRFYQYSTKLESTDSFDVLLDTYAPPFESSGREEKFDQAPLGWSAWLRPGTKKVFLEMTDDDEDMPVETFVARLLAEAPEHFGSDPTRPSFVFHSIIGIEEKADPIQAYLSSEPVHDQTCTGNDNEVQNAGESYQELSRMTGGLRFPLCQFGAYDVVFQTIAEDVVQRRGIACDFEIPQPPSGRELDLDTVAIAYDGSDGVSVPFGQAPTPEACQPNAFYIDGGRVNLCPDACLAVSNDPMAKVSVLFTCENQLIVPR